MKAPHSGVLRKRHNGVVLNDLGGGSAVLQPSSAPAVKPITIDETPDAYTVAPGAALSFTHRLNWTGIRSGRHKAFHRNLPGAAARLPQIVGHLHSQPRLRRRAEGFR